MSYTKFIIFSLFLSINVLAHDSDQAHFRIIQNDIEITVLAEFPWTIRKALMAFKPELKNNKDEESFENAFFVYIKSNLILSDLNGNKLDLISVEQLNHHGHSHQTNYQFNFRKGNLQKVHNTILFNTNSHQKNFHSFKLNEQNIEFKTTNDNPEFKLSSKKETSFSRNLLWLVVLVSVPIFVWRRRTNFK